MRRSSSAVETSWRAELDRARAQPRRQVVVIALEAVARDAERGGERVQFLEFAVDGHVAPVLDGEPQVVVLAQGIDEHGHGSGGPSWRLGLEA